MWTAAKKGTYMHAWTKKKLCVYRAIAAEYMRLYYVHAAILYLVDSNFAVSRTAIMAIAVEG